jgi:hypothetical protein
MAIQPPPAGNATGRRVGGWGRFGAGLGLVGAGWDHQLQTFKPAPHLPQTRAGCAPNCPNLHPTCPKPGRVEPQTSQTCIQPAPNLQTGPKAPTALLTCPTGPKPKPVSSQNVHRPGLELMTFCVWGKRGDHCTTTVMLHDKAIALYRFMILPTGRILPSD